MDINFINDFENLKISALRKAKLISTEVKCVTLGPNSIKTSTTITENKRNNETNRKVKEVIKVKSHSSLDDSLYGRALAEAEKQRRDEVENTVQSRIANINAGFQRLTSNSKEEWLRRQQTMIEQNRRQEDMMLKILQEHDKKAYDQAEQLHQQYQKQQDERHRRNMELQNKEKERRQMIALLESIHTQLTNFRSTYQEIVGILKSCCNPKCISKIVSNNANVKVLPEMMDKIKEKCKVQKIDETDLQKAEALVKEIKELKTIIAQQVVQENELERQQLEQIERERAKTDKKVSEPIPKPAEEQKPVESSVQQTANVQPSSSPALELRFVSKENLRTYAELQQFLDNYENGFKELASDPKLKQFRFALQKAVNIPLNAISAVSSQHLHDKYRRLSDLLAGQRVEAGGTTACAAQHPQGVAFCTELLARKFVLQGDLMVSGNPESAHCFAAVLAALWLDHPDFGRLVLAHFQRAAPYLVPMYPAMAAGQSERDYLRALGYTRSADGTVERHDKFLKRMAGIVRLYAAVCVSRLRRAHAGRAHPHGLARAWAWLAAVLALEPRVDITATVLFEFLEVVGAPMQAAYGRQFDKLLAYLRDYLPRIQKIDSGGPMTRLEVFLQKIQQTGYIEAPKGRLAEGFW